MDKQDDHSREAFTSAVEEDGAMRHAPQTPQTQSASFRLACANTEFLLRARALVACPGGFGTLDELFETLTLIQTGKVKRVSVLLFGHEYRERVVDFDAMVEEGTIDATDLELFSYVESAEEARAAIRAFLDGGASPCSSAT